MEEKLSIVEEGRPRNYQGIKIESSGSYDWNNASNLGVSWLTGSLLITNITLGAALLTYPELYHQLGGIVTTTIIQLVIIVLSLSTMYAMCLCADLDDLDTYDEVLEYMCGRLVRQVGALFVMATSFGICITILVIVGDVSDRLMDSIFGHHFCHHWYLHRNSVIVLVALVFAWPSSCVQQVPHVKLSSYLGLVSSIYFVFTCIYQFIKLDDKAGKILRYPDNTRTFLTSIPIVVFAYQTQVNVIPIYGSFRYRNAFNLFKSSVVSLVGMYLVYTLVGIFGYITFGSHIGHDLLYLYDPNDPVVIIAIVLVLTKLITTYPQMIVTGRQSCMAILQQDHDEDKTVRRIVMTCIMNVVILYLALITTNLNHLIQIIGSLTSITSYVLPGVCLCLLSTSPSATMWWSRVQCIAAFAYGIVISLFGVSIFLIGYINITNDEDDKSIMTLCS